MFSIGDYAVCPGHGVGQVVDIEERDLGTSKQSFYIIKILANGMTVMVPITSKNGIRSLVQSDTVTEVFGVLSNHDVDVDTSTWNRRFREYTAKVTTGSLVEIAEVLRELFLLSNRKSLSYGEKKMLDQCRELIAQEISLTQGAASTDVKVKINSYFLSDSSAS